jgi:hypothetical protein
MQQLIELIVLDTDVLISYRLFSLYVPLLRDQ